MHMRVGLQAEMHHTLSGATRLPGRRPTTAYFYSPPSPPLLVPPSLPRLLKIDESMQQCKKGAILTLAHSSLGGLMCLMWRKGLGGGKMKSQHSPTEGCSPAALRRSRVKRWDTRRPLTPEVGFIRSPEHTFPQTKKALTHTGTKKSLYTAVCMLAHNPPGGTISP